MEKEFKHELNELKEEKKFIDEKIISIIKKIFVTIPDLEIEIFETKMTESDIFLNKFFLFNSILLFSNISFIFFKSSFSIS